MKTQRSPQTVNVRRYGRCGVGSFILMEVVAALALTGVLLTAMSGLVISFNRAGDFYVSHYRAQLAAESYVEHLRAGRPEPDQDDGVQFDVTRRPGQGEWSGLTHLTVTAVVETRFGRSVRYTLTTYLPESKP